MSMPISPGPKKSYPITPEQNDEVLDPDPDPLSDPQFAEVVNEEMHHQATKQFETNKENVDKWAKNFGKGSEDDDDD